MGSTQAKRELNDADIEMLVANTDFNREQIMRWYEMFKEECKDGLFDKPAFIKFYTHLLPDQGNPVEFANYVFTAFDKDDSGYIDFNEFLLAFSTTAKGSLKDRLDWAFNYYDQDRNNSIDSKELKKVLQSIYKMMGVKNSENTANSAENKAMSIFQVMDLNHDRKISRDEFIKSCLDDPFLRHLLGPNV